MASNYNANVPSSPVVVAPSFAAAPEWRLFFTQLLRRTGDQEGGSLDNVRVKVENITDASDVGKTVLIAEDEAAARTAIGAGTSDVALSDAAAAALAKSAGPGTSADASRSDHVHPFPSASDIGALPSDGQATSAESADKLTTARKIAVSGAVTGSVEFDGSEDVDIETTATKATKTVAGAVLQVDRIADITAAPTAANFNALLAALVSSGLMSST